MVFNFDQYLGTQKTNEGLLATQPDAKKYRLIADFLKTSVGLISTKGENLYVATTPLGDKLVACFSEDDLLTIHSQHLDKVYQEAIKNLQNAEYSYDTKEQYLVDIVGEVTDIHLKIGVWQDFYFIPNDNPNLRFKTAFGNSSSTTCLVKIEDGVAKLYGVDPINFKTVEVESAIKQAIGSKITIQDSINYALKKVHIGWEEQTANAFDGYKIYLPKS